MRVLTEGRRDGRADRPALLGLRDRVIGSTAVGMAILSGAVALRFALLGGRDLFRDEAASWLLAAYPWDGILRHLGFEPYPPLYPFALKAWMGLVGDSEVALRAFSAIAGIGLLAVTWAWARQAVGRWPALVAAGVVALSPLAIANAREVRMYALESFFATVAWWLLWRLLAVDVEPRVRLWTVALAGLAIAGELWTMPTGAAAFGLQMLAVAVVGVRARVLGSRRRASSRRSAWPAVAALSIGLIAFLPWVPQLLDVVGNGQGFWTSRPGFISLLDTVDVVFAGTDPAPAELASPVLAALAAIGLVALYRTRDERSFVTAVWLSAGIGLIAAWWGASLLRPAYDPRYLGAAVPPIALSIALGLRSVAQRLQGFLDRRLMWVAVSTVAVLFATASVPPWAVWLKDYGTAPARAIAQELQRQVQPGDVVLAVDARSYFPLAYEVHRSQAPIHLGAPLWFWRVPNERVFYGGPIIDDAESISPASAERAGGLSIPGLSPMGSIWIAALTNGNAELRGFAPLVRHQVVEVERLIVRGGGYAVPLVRLRLLPPTPT